MGKRIEAPGKPTIDIVETEDFEALVGKYLNDNEHAALYLLLANNPLAGTPSQVDNRLFELEYTGKTITYLVTADLKEIFLLSIGAKLKEPTAQEKSALKKLLDVIVKIVGPVIAAEKAWALLKKLAKFLKNHFPPEDWPF